MLKESPELSSCPNLLLPLRETALDCEKTIALELGKIVFSSSLGQRVLGFSFVTLDKSFNLSASLKWGW
jgi:hypothetical protein